MSFTSTNRISAVVAFHIPAIQIAFFSFTINRGNIGTSMALISMKNFKAQNTIYCAISCYSGVDGEAYIQAGSDTIAASISKCDGDPKCFIAIPYMSK